MIKDIVNNELNVDHDEKVIVQFWAQWCGPCRMLKPVIETISQDIDFREVSFNRVDIDVNQDLANEMGVRSIPTLVFMKNGVEVDRIVGFKPEEYLKENLIKEFNLTCSLDIKE